MYMFYLIAIIFFIIGYIFKSRNKKTIETRYVYNIKKNPMTEIEQKFIKSLQLITNKYNLYIVPQVQLQSIFKIIDKKDISSFNKIKSKSVDFAIVDKDYNFKMFIELDDYTHNRQNRIKRDIFVNNLFNMYNLNLKRIKVQNNYNLEELENMIKEVVI